MTDSTRAGYAIDPELTEFVALMGDTPPLTDAVEARDRIGAFVGFLNADLDVSTLDDRRPGDPGPRRRAPVPVRVYAPAERDGTALPAILYIHGGGFFSGSIESEHGGAVGLARGLGVVVVSVEYRLAPEHPFPAGLDDCYAALEWLAGSADDLGVDVDRIAVNGGSAGGGLAAAVALLARDRGGPSLCFQYLGIPELDDRLATPSMQQFVDTPVWSRPSAVKSWEWYLGDHAGEVSPYAAPARGDRPRGPPAGLRVGDGVRPAARRGHRLRDPHARRGRVGRAALLPGDVPRVGGGRVVRGAPARERRARGGVAARATTRRAVTRRTS